MLGGPVACVGSLGCSWIPCGDLCHMVPIRTLIHAAHAVGHSDSGAQRFAREVECVLAPLGRIGLPRDRPVARPALAPPLLAGLLDVAGEAQTDVFESAP